MNFNRSQLSGIITICSLSILVLLLYNIHLGAEEQEEYVIELSLADEDLEALLEEEEKLNEQLQADQIESHMAYNETAKPSFGNPEPLKTLEELMEEKEAASETGEQKEFLSTDEGYAANLKELSQKREEKKQFLGEKDAQKKEITQNLAKRRTSVSYSLIGRTNFKLPPPIYTCIEGGTIVVNIKVDPLGNVVQADFNDRSSNTSNGCLVDNAITYAFRAKFDAAEGKGMQIGTITYIYQSK